MGRHGILINRFHSIQSSSSSSPECIPLLVLSSLDWFRKKTEERKRKRKYCALLKQYFTLVLPVPCSPSISFLFLLSSTYCPSGLVPAVFFPWSVNLLASPPPTGPSLLYLLSNRSFPLPSSCLSSVKLALLISGSAFFEIGSATTKKRKKERTQQRGKIFFSLDQSLLFYPPLSVPFGSLFFSLFSDSISPPPFRLGGY
uniref:Uncharacterized protein n=1 Tax=Cacopsylla melanoneura TaxID=428564 RepID=A0A8D8ZCI9_9HEMI